MFEVVAAPYDLAKEYAWSDEKQVLTGNLCPVVFFKDDDNFIGSFVADCTMRSFGSNKVPECQDHWVEPGKKFDLLPDAYGSLAFVWPD